MYRHIIKVKLPKFRLTCCRNSFSFSRKLQRAQVSRSVSGNLPWRKNCHLHTCLWPKWSPHPLQGNMCCLGRYKGVILLLGTSPLRSHFISPFQPPQKPLFDLIFQSMTASNQSDSVYFHLENTFSVGGVAVDGRAGGSDVERDSGKFLYHMLMSSCRDFSSTVPDCWEPNFLFHSPQFDQRDFSFSVIKKNLSNMSTSSPHKYFLARKLLS